MHLTDAASAIPLSTHAPTFTTLTVSCVSLFPVHLQPASIHLLWYGIVESSSSLQLVSILETKIKKTLGCGSAEENWKNQNGNGNRKGNVELQQPRYNWYPQMTGNYNNCKTDCNKKLVWILISQKQHWLLSFRAIGTVKRLNNWHTADKHVSWVQMIHVTHHCSSLVATPLPPQCRLSHSVNSSSYFLSLNMKLGMIQ